jgi:hypothetical protein
MEPGDVVETLVARQSDTEGCANHQSKIGNQQGINYQRSKDH